LIKGGDATVTQLMISTWRLSTWHINTTTCVHHFSPQRSYVYRNTPTYHAQENKHACNVKQTQVCVPTLAAMSIPASQHAAPVQLFQAGNAAIRPIATGWPLAIGAVWYRCSLAPWPSVNHLLLLWSWRIRWYYGSHDVPFRDGPPSFLSLRFPGTSAP
jgi:hypothetical protein